MTMRLIFMSIASIALSATSHAASAASKNNDSFSLIISERNADGSVHHESVTFGQLQKEETALPLTSLWDVYDFENHVDLTCDGENFCTLKNVPLEQDRVCFTGNIGRVCNMLAQMSTWSKKFYEDGDHQRSVLTSCHIMGRGKPVEARLRMISDFSDKEVETSLVINRCE